MAERKKLELELNKTMSLELLFDEPMIGQSQDMVSITCTQLRMELMLNIHSLHLQKLMNKLNHFVKVKDLKSQSLLNKKELRLLLVMMLKCKRRNLESPVNDINKNSNDNFYELMLTSCRDAVKIQNELGGLMDAKSLAVTLFIARSKINQNGYAG